MLRSRLLAMFTAALALLGVALMFAPVGSTQSGIPTLSPTPPVKLAPPSTGPAPSGTPRPRLPKTGLEIGLVALLGLGLLSTGTVLRQAHDGPASRRRVASASRRRRASASRRRVAPASHRRG